MGGNISDPRPVPLRFSILTPTLNRADMLANAVASVHAQAWPNVEHIVADGGSSDGTLAMLAGRAVRVLPGPDDGIYHGLNRAVAAATGDVVGWLNSDDVYAPGAFAAAAAAFDRQPDLAAVCGGAQIEADGKMERSYAAALLADLSPGALLIGPTLPNAWFFRKSVFDAVGPFSTELKYAADSDWMQRFARLKPKCSAEAAVFYRYRRHAGSATISTSSSAPLYHDMLKLALMWRDDADAETRAVAAALEGRARALLAGEALKRGDVAAACAQLAGHAPQVVRGVLDYGRRRISPALRARRVGSPGR